MTDERKMTDSEIIKALECCSKDDIDCEQCPANGLCDTDDYCFTGAILDLINRKDAEIEENNLKIDHQAQIIRTLETALADKMAEIERLQEDISTLNDEIYAIGTSKAEELADELTKAQTEAIKEFAERLSEKVEKVRQKFQRLCKEQGEKEDEVMNIHFEGIVKLIDKLKKEMAESKNENTP